MSSFANAVGGDLLFGVTELRENNWTTGTPESVDGLAGPVLIIRTRRSRAGPHMVTFQQHSRFYARNATGKNALDVFELRSAFLNSGSLRERAREFRAERLGRLLGRYAVSDDKRQAHVRAFVASRRAAG